jgi:hypothetical protein
MLNQSRWALSSDHFLQSVGTNTGINYRKDFEEYLEILIKVFEKRRGAFSMSLGSGIGLFSPTRIQAW